MSRPDATAIVERLYELAGPLAQHDSDDDGWIVLAYCAAMVGSEQETWALLEDPGLAAYLTPETAPADWLPLLAAANGARITSAMTEAEMRVEVRHPSGWARGQPATMIANVRKYLVPGATVHLLRRYNPHASGDHPYDMTLQVREADILTDQLPALQAAFQAQMVTGDTGWVLPGARWMDEAAVHATSSAAAAAHTTWSSYARGH